MTDTKNLIRQHDDILALAKKIAAYQSDRQIVKDAFPITLLIGQLAGKLKIHMSTEDKFVYPALATHPNQQVQATSRLFANEMGDLAKAFENYKSKYLNTRQIADNPASFKAETQAVFSAVIKRIEKENTQLYPLLG